jgi:hypothetical protein
MNKNKAFSGRSRRRKRRRKRKRNRKKEDELIVQEPHEHLQVSVFLETTTFILA